MSTNHHRGQIILSVVGVLALIALIQPYWSLAQSADRIQDLEKQIMETTCTVVITWPTEPATTTTYYEVTDYNVSDNGTITFKGKKGSTTATAKEYTIGHGTYTEAEKECE